MTRPARGPHVNHVVLTVREGHLEVNTGIEPLPFATIEVDGDLATKLEFTNPPDTPEMPVTVDNIWKGSLLQVKAGFSEADATKVQVGQTATISFDSLPNTRLTAKVASVDVTPTTVSNVVTYYAWFAFDQPPADGTVKPGMTATATVTVASVSNVIYVPTAAVPSTRGTAASVAVEMGNDPNRTRQVAVTVGLKGDNGVEITSGLQDTDKVVVTRSLAAGTAGTGTGATGFPGGGAGGLGGGGGAGGGVRVGGGG